MSDVYCKIKVATSVHQEFQVPKMEGFLKFILDYLGGVGKFSYISLFHTAYIGYRIPPI